MPGTSTGYWGIALREFPLHDYQDPLSCFLCLLQFRCYVNSPGAGVAGVVFLILYTLCLVIRLARVINAAAAAAGYLRFRQKGLWPNR